MRKIISSLVLLVMMLTVLAFPAVAQTDVATPTPSAANLAPSLTLYTDFPSQVSGIAETVSINLTLKITGPAQIVTLQMKDVPAGWTATFRGGGRIINSAYVIPDKDASVELRLEPGTAVKAGKYSFTAAASGAGLSATLPLELTVTEKAPAKLTLTTDLPTLLGTPSTVFSWNLTLSNEGDDDLTVNLSADSLGVFAVKYNYNGQDVTTLPVAAKASKSLNISASPINDLQAGTYPVSVKVQGGTAQATLALTAEVTGQSSLSLTTPDGLLSGSITSGTATPIKITVKNTGTAPASKITLSADTPTSWTATFNPASIAELAANQQIDVTVNVTPADKAVAGDYQLTLHASPANGGAKSVDYRVTLVVSTLWGVVGIALIALAVGVVLLAVIRFGRR